MRWRSDGERRAERRGRRSRRAAEWRAALRAEDLVLGELLGADVDEKENVKVTACPLPTALPPH
eukprot:3935419-Pleurochrysis_carterae.AAC.1